MKRDIIYLIDVEEPNLPASKKSGLWAQKPEWESNEAFTCKEKPIYISLNYVMGCYRGFRQKKSNSPSIST